MSIKLIAEICSSHNQDLNRAIQLIEYSAELGFDAVKFQLFKADKLYAPQHKQLIELYKKRELPVEWLPTLKKVSHDHGLEFGCTPFYLEAVDELDPYVDFFKIGSFENQWKDLIQKIYKTGRPTMMSLGMLNLWESLENLVEYKWIDVFFHCVSCYPTAPIDCNIDKIYSLKSFVINNNKYVKKDWFPIIGWSDHSANEGVIYRAIAEGAKVIELHVDLPDKEGLETSPGHVWTDRIILAPLIKNIRDGEKAIGDGRKTPSKCEIENMKWKCNPKTGLRG